MTLLLLRLLSLLLLLLIQPLNCLISNSPCTFLCGDGLTCLADQQVCDGFQDCPAHQGGEGEDEQVCSRSQEEEQGGNSLETGEDSGDTLCEGAETSLVAEPTDCRVFYHCEDSLAQPQSCGELMFNPRRQTCDWPRTVMQIRPECRNPASFMFRLGPQSWDSRRTQRMMNWLGTSSPARLQQTRPQTPHTHSRRIHHRQSVLRAQTPVFRSGSIQVQDQQRARVLLPARQPVSPHRLLVPSLEAPRPHVVRIKPTQHEVQRILPRQEYQQVPQQAVTQRVVPQQVITYHTVPTPVITQHTVTKQTVKEQQSIKEQQARREQQTLKEQQAKKKQDLTFVISNLVTERLRASLPRVLSDLRTGQVAKQTKVKQEPVQRVTHTVTSTSSHVSPAAPTHHYTQETFIGEPEGTDIEESEVTDFTEPDVTDFMEPEVTDIEDSKLTDLPNLEMKVREEENTEEIHPKLSPILVEETREHKPVWTVTRERPRQMMNRPLVVPEEDLSSGPRVLQKVRRKLFEEDRTKLKEKRRMLWKAASKDRKIGNVEKKRKVLLKTVPEETKQEQQLYQELEDVLEELKDATSNPKISLNLSNGLEEDLDEEERKAIEEAYDINIARLRMEDPTMEREPANSLHLIHSYSRLLEMMLEDFEGRQNVDSSEEEQNMNSSENSEYMDSSEGRQYGDSSEGRHYVASSEEKQNMDNSENIEYMDYSEGRQYVDSSEVRQYGDSSEDRQYVDYSEVGQYVDSIADRPFVDYSESRQYVDSSQLRSSEYN